ncbi:MAG: hypothetical protein CL609_20095 [Anaerolineaceae bacterium]|nr:hypothetical protein [Anaerolineaceae bacterium]
MSLRKTTLFVIFSIFLLLAVVLSISLRSILSAHFRSEETQQSSLNLQRTRIAFENNYTILDYFSGDWGKWNATYEYVDDGNFEYINDNLVESTYSDLGVNIILILDLEGNILYGGSYDLLNHVFLPFPQQITETLVTGEGLLDFSENTDIRHGLIFIDDQPLLISVSPILTTLGEGPIKGSFIIGRYFTEESKQVVAKQVQFPVRVVQFDQSVNLENDFLLAKRFFEENTADMYSIPLTSSIMGGYLLVKDVNQDPALIIRIEQPRTSSRSTEILLLYMVIGLMTSSIFFAAIIYSLIERVILTRVLRMSEEVQQIAKTPDQTRYVSVDRKDELTTLGIKVNQMLDSLASARNETLLLEERLRGVVESIDDIVFSVNSDLSQIQFFGNAYQSYGIEFSHLTLDEMNKYFSEDMINSHEEPIRRAMAGEHLIYEWSTKINDQIRHFQISLAPLKNKADETEGIVGVARDTTVFKGLEIQLRQHFDELKVLYDVSRLFLATQSLQTTQEELCRLAVEQFVVEFAWLGYLNEEKNWIEPLASANLPIKFMDPLLISAENKPDIDKIKNKEIVVFEKTPITSHHIKVMESPYLMVLPLFWEKSPIMMLCLGVKEKPQLSDQRKQFFRSFSNLAEMALSNVILLAEIQNNQEQLQDLSERLVQAHEDERRWLARELHDEIGQYLTALKLRLSIEDFPTKEDQQRILHAQELVNELINKVRQISLDLRPSMLDDLGLLSTLIWFFERYTQQTEIQVIFTQNIERQRFSSNVEITAFRIIQESLTNVARYAEVEFVMVKIEFVKNQLLIELTDEGKGFNQEHLVNEQGSGIMGMRERVRLLQGELSIKSSEGMGTQIKVTLPVEEKKADDN